MTRINLPGLLFTAAMIFVFLAPALIETHPGLSAGCAVAAAVLVHFGNKENGGRDV